MEVAAEEELQRVYDARLIRLVWSFVRPYRRLFWLSVLMMPLNSAFVLAQPYVVKLTTDLFLVPTRILPPAWLRPILTPALKAFAGNGPLLVVINLFAVRARVTFRLIRERVATLHAYLSEAIGGMPVIQLFTRERESIREFDHLNRLSRDAQMLSNIYDAGQFTAVEVIS